MSENYYIYVVQYVGVSSSDPASFGWEIPDIHEGKFRSPFLGYIESKMELIRDEDKFDVTFRRYKAINSSVFIIKSSEQAYNGESYEKSLTKIGDVFEEVIAKSGLTGIGGLLEPILLRNLGRAEDLNDIMHLLSPIILDCDEDNIIFCLDKFQYFVRLNLNYDSKLSNTMLFDIITLLSLPQIAVGFSDLFLRLDDPFIMDPASVIYTLLGQKSLLQTGSAILIFPEYFTVSMAFIDNELAVVNHLLVFRNIKVAEHQIELSRQQITLSELQIKLSEAQNSLSELQTTMQNKVYKIENLMLILTSIVVLDIGLKFFHEILGYTLSVSLASVAVAILILFYNINEIYCGELD